MELEMCSAVNMEGYTCMNKHLHWSHRLESLSKIFNDTASRGLSATAELLVCVYNGITVFSYDRKHGQCLIINEFLMVLI